MSISKLASKRITKLATAGVLSAGMCGVSMADSTDSSGIGIPLFPVPHLFGDGVPSTGWVREIDCRLPGSITTCPLPEVESNSDQQFIDDTKGDGGYDDFERRLSEVMEELGSISAHAKLCSNSGPNKLMQSPDFNFKNTREALAHLCNNVCRITPENKGTLSSNINTTIQSLIKELPRYIQEPELSGLIQTLSQKFSTLNNKIKTSARFFGQQCR